MKTYFAYGSNLCFPRFVARVPSARFVTVAMLPGFKVVFHKRSNDGSGKATIVADPKSSVYGVIYEFKDPDLRSLRKVENYPEQYEEREDIILHTLDEERTAMTYVATEQFFDAGQVPYDWYVELIRFGARRSGLPESYVAQFDTTAAKPDEDQARAARERSFLR